MRKIYHVSETLRNSKNIYAVTIMLDCDLCAWLSLMITMVLLNRKRIASNCLQSVTLGRF